MIDFKALAAPFPPSAVSWRVGSVSGERGMALAYLDARDVMDRLDAVCGPGGWQCRYSHVGQTVVCEIGVKVGDEWIWKADGAGQSDIEAEKGSLSDALKRAAVRFGIGRYLYHLASPWVEIEKRGKTSVIAKHEYAKLEAVLARTGAQEPGAPSLPPPDPTVEEAATRWFRTQKDYLEHCQTVEAVAQWAAREDKALRKLKLQHRNLWDILDESQFHILERLSGATGMPL